MSRRTERIAGIVRDVVAEAIARRLSDPRLEPLVSVTRVEVSPDLGLARVNVSVMHENAGRRQLAVDALTMAAARIRGMLGEHLATRIVPRLTFHLDDSLQRGLRTVEVIEQLNQARAAGQVQPTDEIDAGDDDGAQRPDEGSEDATR